MCIIGHYLVLVLKVASQKGLPWTRKLATGFEDATCFVLWLPSELPARHLPRGPVQPMPESKFSRIGESARLNIRGVPRKFRRFIASIDTPRNKGRSCSSKGQSHQLAQVPSLPTLGAITT